MAMTVEELIAQLEAANGADRKLDEAIWLACGAPTKWFESKVTYYTASIDAALTLVPEGYSAEIHTAAAGEPARAELHIPEKTQPNSMHRWRHLGTCTHLSSPAIAICVVALKVRKAVTEVE
jgi:hypothetical protein